MSRARSLVVNYDLGPGTNSPQPVQQILLAPWKNSAEKKGISLHMGISRRPQNGLEKRRCSEYREASILFFPLSLRKCDLTIK
mgnify:CR=1 FL=1